MESQPQNPEFRINPENFHSCHINNEIASYYMIAHSQLKNYCEYMHANKGEYGNKFIGPDKQNI